MRQCENRTAAEAERLTKLAEELRAQLAAHTSAWEEVIAQLEGNADSS